jgi:LuxR family maltose regulon positive regulatory protein
LIEQAAQTIIAHGRLTTFIRWLEALPEDLLRARPCLRLYQGWALNLGGQIDAAEPVLQDAKATLQSLPPSVDNEALRGQLAALLTGIATQREAMATVIQEARKVLAYLPDEDRISRARVYVALGTAYAYEGNAEQAAQTWQQASLHLPPAALLGQVCPRCGGRRERGAKGDQQVSEGRGHGLGL